MAAKRRVALAVAALALCAAASAPAVTVQSEGLRITALAQILPYKLPRDKPAPIAVFIAGHLQSAAGGIPPQLQGLVIDVNRHGLLQRRARLLVLFAIDIGQTKHAIQP